MLNKVIIGGRLTADPEIRYTQNQTPVANMSIACEEDYAPEGQERGVSFIPIVAWGKRAEFAEKYMKKGRAFTIVGRLRIRQWTDQDGNKRRSTEVIAENIYFADSKRDDDQTGDLKKPEFNEIQDDYSEYADEGDLPF